MRNQEWNATLAELNSLDLAQLVLCLFGGDAVDGEATLGVVDEAEVLASLLDGDNVHEAGWVSGIGADLAIDLDQALHDNRLGLAGVEGVFQTANTGHISIFSSLTVQPLSVFSILPVADEDDQWHAVTQLVRTWRGLGGIGTAELVKQPVGWR